MSSGYKTLIFLILWGLAHKTTPSTTFKRVSETRLVEKNNKAVVDETVQIEMNFEVNMPDDQVGKTVIVSSEIEPGVDWFKLRVTAKQNESICSTTFCPVPELVVWVFANINYKTYSYSAAIKGQTLGLNTNLVGGLKVYPQNPEFTPSPTNTASINAMFFYSRTEGIPKAWTTTNSSFAFKLHVQCTTTAVSITPSASVTPPPVFTPAPNVPSYIDMNVQMFVPNPQIGKSVILSSPISITDGQFQINVSASKNKTLCYTTDISCPEPELVVWVFASINLKTFSYSATVTGQTLGLNIDLANGLKVYPQNPEFTSSATDTTSVIVNFIYNPNNGFPNLRKTSSNPSTVNLNIQTTVFAATSITTTSKAQPSISSRPAHKTTPSTTFKRVSETRLVEKNTKAVVDETVQIEMNFEVNMPDDQVGKTVIVSSEIEPGVDWFKLRVTAKQNESICSTSFCPVPELVVWVFANINYKTYSYSAAVKGQTLGLNTNLVGGLKVYPQNPEFTPSPTNTASINAMFFYSRTEGIPKAWTTTNSSSAFKLHVQCTTTAVSITPSASVTPPPVFTPAPNLPSYIDMNVQVFVPNPQIGKSVILSSPISITDGQFQMNVSASKNKTLCYTTGISCPEPELVVWVFASINLKTFSYSATVTGQTLGLNIDLANGLKVYPQNPEFTSSATDTASVNVNFIYSPNNGFPNLRKTSSNPSTVNLNIQTTVFAATSITTTTPKAQPSISSRPAHERTASTTFKKVSETKMVGKNTKTAEETVQIEMNFDVSMPEDQVGKTVIVSSEIVPGVDQFELKVMAKQNESICSNISCPVPELVVVVFASINYKTYSYSATVTGQTLGLNTNLVGGVNVYPQEPEFRASTANTASVNAMFFYTTSNGLPQASVNVNSSSEFNLHVQCTTTAVSTPSPSVTPPPVFTPAPNVPSNIDLNVQVFVPDSPAQNYVILSSPISFTEGQFEMMITAFRNLTICVFSGFSCPEPELVVWIFAQINFKTFTYSATVTEGQTLGLNVDLVNGLKVYPQNPEFTSSKTGYTSVNVNFIYNSNNGLPNLSKTSPSPSTVNLNIQTTVFAATDTTATTHKARSRASSILDCGPLHAILPLLLLPLILLC